ncbi:SGNH/GDSL hydrolase family protein [Lachnospiraceae bacterium ZAX-1]
MSKLVIGKESKWVMIGDSITDCERARPYGEGLFAGIGTGYVALVDALLQVNDPDKKIRIINMGNSGDTVRELKARWQKDVLDLKPDWTSILIGINDVWRQFDSPLQTESHVYVEEYKESLEYLVKTTLEQGSCVLMITPYYMEPNTNDLMRKTMDMYGAAVKEIAHKYKLPVVDLQASFDQALTIGHGNRFAWDRVHPNMHGHMLIAKKILDQINFEWD